MKKKLVTLSILLCLLIALPMVFISCGMPSTTQYTIQFLDEDGQTIIGKAQKVVQGGKFDLPHDPQKEGYTFDGWLLNGTIFDFNDAGAQKVAGDMTFIAKYSIKVFSVAFYDEDGTTLIGEMQSVEYGKAFTLVTAPQKDGFSFAGWVKAGDSQVYDMYVSGARVVKGDVKFVARYEKSNYVQENNGDTYGNDLPQW